MFVKATAAQIRFLLKRNSAILTFFILLAMVLFNFISNVVAFQGKDVVEMYHPMKLLLLSWNQTYLTPDRTLNFIQLYPLLVVCPAGFALASERQTGEDILLAAKLGNIRYRFSKILAAFAVTMIVFTIPFLIEIILNCLAFPLSAAGDLMNLNCYQEEYFRITESYLFTGLYQVSPYIYAVVLTLLFGILSGILGAFTAAVSSLFYIKFRILLFLPVFALLNVTIMISDWFHMQNSSVSAAWYSYFLLFVDSKTLYGPVFALVVLLLILLTAAGAYIGGRKDCVR